MFLSRLMRRNPRAPQAGSGDTPSGWWQPFVDAGLAKVSDSEAAPKCAEAALGFHAWYRAISLIAQKCAAVSKHLLRRTETDAGEGKERARDHSVYRLVNLRANAEQTAFQFWLQMAGHVPSRGNAYAVIHRVGGQVDELIPMDPDRTHPVRRNGQLWYVTFPFGYDGDGIKFLPSDVLHFRGLGWDGLVGYPVWARAAEEIGLALSQRKMEAARNKNAGRPAMVLQTEQVLPEPAVQRLRDDWERMHTGLDNAGRTAILDRGMKAVPVSLNAEQLQQSGAAQMSLVAISNYTGVPASKLGAGGKSYASQEQEDIAFVADGLDFYLNVFDDEASAKLLTEEERAQGYEVKANRESLLRPALREKFETLRIATAGKPIMTQNEARRQIDLPPSEEPDADKLLTPLNMGQGGIDNQPADTADLGPGRPADNSNGGNTFATSGKGQVTERASAVRQAAGVALSDAARRMVRRVALHAGRAAKEPIKYLAWVDVFGREHGEIVEEAFEPARQMVAVATGNVGVWAVGGTFLLELRAEYSRVADTASAGSLTAAVEKLNADLETRMPRRMCELFLGGGA